MICYLHEGVCPDCSGQAELDGNNPHPPQP